jgi:septum formation protein
VAERLVLASSSPRRRELLTGLGLRFEARAPDIDERAQPGESAHRLVERLATEKAAAVAGTGEVVLAADSVVVIDDRILGKPADPAEAEAMLRLLSGRTHEVATGVAVARDGGEPAAASAVVTSLVTFVDISDHELAWYVAGGEPFDKAGGYGLQGVGIRFVRAVEGSPSNVIGLPLVETFELAASIGVDLASFRGPDR